MSVDFFPSYQASFYTRPRSLTPRGSNVQRRNQRQPDRERDLREMLRFHGEISFPIGATLPLQSGTRLWSPCPFRISRPWAFPSFSTLAEFWNLSEHADASMPEWKEFVRTKFRKLFELKKSIEDSIQCSWILGVNRNRTRDIIRGFQVIDENAWNICLYLMSI